MAKAATAKAGSALVYCVCSIGATIMMSSYLKLWNAWFLTLYQQATIFIMVPIFAMIGGMGVPGFASFYVERIRLGTLMKVWPAGFFAIATVVSNNICLKLVGPAELDVAKGTVLLFSVVTSYVFLNTKQTHLAMLGVGVVTSAFLLNGARYIEQPEKLGSLAIGCFTALSGSLQAVLSKKVMKHVDFKATVLLHYNSVVSLILLPALVYIYSPESYVKLAKSPLSLVILFPCGMVGLTINLLTQVTLKFFSPLSFNIIGQFKNLFQSIVSMAVGAAVRNPALIAPLTLKFVGSLIYVVAKQIETSMNAIKRFGAEVLEDEALFRLQVDPESIGHMSDIGRFRYAQMSSVYNEVDVLTPMEFWDDEDSESDSMLKHSV
ncbi:MAG: uncharacterized protein KVP18_002422 [Porospora cf. gigantea A]|uniref:uncharacterized protein n=1 Tax=Porospora cf. gigantea A TaxID=2853593 RepID=UPI00355A4C36|nr:MAG: hypothetical protein KVP18_002422 [Porospora cf. gigantea A]